MKLCLRGVKSWVSLSAYGILDQGVVSGANFLMSIYLARELQEKDYGLFALVLTVYYLAFTVHQSLIHEPIGVLAIEGKRRSGDAYFHALRFANFLLCASIGAIFLAISSVLYFLGSHAAPAYIVLALVSPLLLWLWFIKRASYVFASPRLNLTGNLVYLFAMLGGAWALKVRGLLGVESALMVMGVAGWLGGLCVAKRLYPHFGGPFVAVSVQLLRRVVLDHWAYGKWMLANMLVAWMSLYLYLPVLASMRGLEAAGAFRALENTFLPYEQAMTAVVFLLTPWLVRCRAEEKCYNLGRAVIRIAVLSTIAAVLYALPVSIAAKQLMSVLYGNALYTSFSWLLPLLGLVAICRGITDLALGAALRAIRRSDIIFKASLSGPIVMWTVGVWMVSRWGLVGAVVGKVIVCMVSCVVLFVASRRVINDATRSSEGDADAF